ncbi:MAG: hypothetical protein IKP49_13555 [Treponema sp.]|nr:hypothetical protein [Treponema sp.]
MKIENSYCSIYYDALETEWYNKKEELRERIYAVYNLLDDFMKSFLERRSLKCAATPIGKSKIKDTLKQLSLSLKNAGDDIMANMAESAANADYSDLDNIFSSISFLMHKDEWHEISLCIFAKDRRADFLYVIIRFDLILNTAHKLQRYILQHEDRAFSNRVPILVENFSADETAKILLELKTPSTKEFSELKNKMTEEIESLVDEQESLDTEYAEIKTKAAKLAKIRAIKFASVESVVKVVAEKKGIDCEVQDGEYGYDDSYDNDNVEDFHSLYGKDSVRVLLAIDGHTAEFLVPMDSIETYDLENCMDTLIATCKQIPFKFRIFQTK